MSFRAHRRFHRACVLPTVPDLLDLWHPARAHRRPCDEPEFEVRSNEPPLARGRERQQVVAAKYGMIRRLLVLGLFFGPRCRWGSGKVTFNEYIRPILSANCFNAMAAMRSTARPTGARHRGGGDGGAQGVRAIVPGDLENSSCGSASRVRTRRGRAAAGIPPGPAETGATRTHQALDPAGRGVSKHWAYEPVSRPVVPAPAGEPVRRGQAVARCECNPQSQFVSFAMSMCSEHAVSEARTAITWSRGVVAQRATA